MLGGVSWGDGRENTTHPKQADRLYMVGVLRALGDWGPAKKLNSLSWLF